MSMEEHDWFYFTQDDLNFGPFTLKQILEYAYQGEIQTGALVCRAGEESWSTIPDHQFLGPKLQAALIANYNAERRKILDMLLIADARLRDWRIERLSQIQVYYGSNYNRMGPTSLWQVLDAIDAENLPINIKV